MSKSKNTNVQVIITTTNQDIVQDSDIKAIYLINEAMLISTPRMRKANLEFVLSKYKIYVS